MSDSVEIADFMTATEIEPVPDEMNVLEFDGFHMGSTLGSNIFLMFPNHSSHRSEYVIVCNTETGRRVRIDFS